MRTNVPEALTQAKHRQRVSQVFKTRNQSRHVPLILAGTMAGVMMDGMMTGVLLDGTKVGKHTYDTSASSFSLGGIGQDSIGLPVVSGI